MLYARLTQVYIQDISAISHLCSAVFEPNTCTVWSNVNTLLAYVFSYLQGVDEGPDGLKLISDVIQEKLGITMSVLMGANIANEVADEKFCETTIG